jgi:hypothetical protein
MNRTKLRGHLDQAEDDLREEARHIERQRAAIAKLKKDGHNTKQARALLRMMNRSTQPMQRHRKILLERLGLYDPRARASGKKAAKPRRPL